MTRKTADLSLGLAVLVTCSVAIAVPKPLNTVLDNPCAEVRNVDDIEAICIGKVLNDEVSQEYLTVSRRSSPPMYFALSRNENGPITRDVRQYTGSDVVPTGGFPVHHEVSVGIVYNRTSDEEWIRATINNGTQKWKIPDSLLKTAGERRKVEPPTGSPQ